MRSWMAALAVLTGCAEPAQEATPRLQQATAVQDAAGNRIESLTEQDGAHCTADGRFCVETAASAVLVRRGDEQTAAIPIGAGEGAWPAVVRVGEHALFGVTRTVEQMYSGGSAVATHVTLYDVSGTAPQAVLTAPLSGTVSIRACFDEDDAAARRQSCLDEYQFESEFGLDAAVSEGPPRFVLITEATTYPGRRSRSADSTQQAPLQQSDLVWARDETCSYRRLASREDGAYVWDAPLPPCADYLEP